MEADRRIRHKRALLMERAAKALGMRGGKNPEAGFLLAGMIAVYVDSPSMRESGLTGLRWRGTAAELPPTIRVCDAPSERSSDCSRDLRKPV